MSTKRGECPVCHTEQDVAYEVIAAHVSLVGIAMGISVCLGSGRPPKKKDL